MKRILLYIPTFSLGGAERQAIELAKFINQSGNYACIVGSDQDGKVNELCIEEHIRCINLQSIKIPKYILRLVKWKYWHKTGVKSDFFIMRFVRALCTVIDREQIDAVITYCAFPGTVAGTAKILSSHFPKFIWYQRDAGLYNYETNIQKNAICVADIRLANAVTGQNWIRKQYDLDSTIIYNGVEERKPKYSPAEWRRKLHITKDANIVTMVANLSSAKDHITLLKAWRLFKKRRIGDTSVLVLAGSWCDTYNEVRDYIMQNQISDSVFVPGQVEDVFGLYKASASAVLSSRSEGSSNSVIEACLAELPIVACDIEEIRSIVSEENWEFLFESKNPHACADALEKVLYGCKDQIGKANRVKALYRFSSQKNFTKLLDMISVEVNNGTC